MTARPVGFIGLGTMGRAMAHRLLDEGVSLVLNDLLPDAAEALLVRGARWAASARDVAEGCDEVLLSLPGPPEVTEVVDHPDGLLAHLRPGSVIVDLTTNSVAEVRALAQKARDRRVDFIDAPVSGGSQGSRDGTLLMMVGARKGALDRVRPLLEKLARRIFHLGESGAGSTAKLVHNQQYIAGQILFFEGLILAAKAGLKVEEMCEILELTGVGGVHTRLVERVLKRRYDDRTFTLRLAEKDMRLGLESGRALEVPLPTTEAAHHLLGEALEAGFADKNFWAAIEVAERRAGVELRSEASDE